MGVTCRVRQIALFPSRMSAQSDFGQVLGFGGVTIHDINSVGPATFSMSFFFF